MSHRLCMWCRPGETFRENVAAYDISTAALIVLNGITDATKLMLTNR
jgi:hypothetical protein